ncbi:MAG: YraN family protein [Ruminococcus sp.]|jgi:putative endonuclease|nr:YraN family protein [Ruminococcus sp.]MBQ1903839.1 YraN family protein [Ruminococcus sp.]MBQ3937359.1 YraN family protein [Ruminococcus sp.]
MQSYQKNSRKIGDIGEQATADFLQRHGYAILERNYTVRGGEIDIIASKDNVTAFVEVKTRKENPLEQGEQAITPAKKKRLVAAAQRYIDEVMMNCDTCRFDVAVVTVSDNAVKHLKYYVNAFDGSKQ